MPPPRAHLARRLAALGYDLLLFGAVLWFLTFVLVAARGGRAIPAGTPWYTASLVLAAYLFFGWFWTHGGQTLGMRAWRLKVVRRDGASLSWIDAAWRFIAATLGVAALGAGFWSCYFDRERRCWHDRIARTHVRYEPPATGPARKRST